MVLDQPTESAVHPVGRTGDCSSVELCGYKTQRLSIFERGESDSGAGARGIRVVECRQRYGRCFWICGNSMGGADCKCPVLSGNLSQLVLNYVVGCEDRELPREYIQQNQCECGEKNDRRESHQEIGNNQAVAYLPEHVTHQPAPEERNADDDQ